MSYNEHLTTGLAGLWNCTASEAAERVAAKRKIISYESVRDVPWTATRCNRLLRTITSRVNLLRKQSKLGTDGPCVRHTEPISRRSLETVSSKESPSPRGNNRNQANDPTWLPGAQWKATARIYGGRSKSQAKPAPHRTDSGFSTPFVKRLLDNEVLSTSEQSFKSFDTAGSDSLKRQSATMRQLPIQLSSSNEEAQRNLVAAFNSLLVTTSSVSTLPVEPERTGARSLMSVCISRVPHYIDLEAEDTHQSNVDTEDVVSSIYADLESLGTNSDGGWSRLREVVRSHCVHLVCTAIEDGLIHDARISELVTACSRNGALAEASALIRSWLRQHRSGASTRLDESNFALAKLAELRTSHDAPELYLRQFTELINLDCVWIADVLRPGCTSLKDLIKALVRGPGQEVALTYLEAAVMKDCETSNTTSLPVFTRLAGLLASVALTRAGGRTESSNDLDLSAVVHRIAIRVMQYHSGKQELQTRHHDSTGTKTRSNGIHPFIMADTLLQLAMLSRAPSIVSIPMDTSISAIAECQHAFVKFVCSVAQHVSRFSEADEIESLLLTISGFLSPPPECCDENRDLLSRLGFETAFAFSEQTGVEIDHRFADTISANNKEKNLPDDLVQTPRRRVQVSGFKWEEGLCEWVAATPLPLSCAVQSKSSEQEDTPNSKNILRPEHDESRQTPRKPTTLVLPSSPDIIAAGENPAEAPKHPVAVLHKTAPQATRPALKERSANQPPLPPKQVRFSSSAEKESDEESDRKPTRLLKPVVPKQVHLKVERAKRAALLLAQNAAATASGQTITSSQAPPPPKQLKRSLSFADNTKSGTRDDKSRENRVVLADSDELGLLTPVRKKRSSTRIGARSSFHSHGVKGKRLSTAAKVPMQEMHDEMSDDELGL
jgi:hypothetical protein